MMEIRRRSVPGIILILVSAMLVMLILLGLSILQLTALIGRASAATLSAGQAKLAAASGCEYAMARLFQSGDPMAPANVENRCESWVCRDPASVSVEMLKHPSYAHGESWTDSILVTGDGIDNDGDGLTDALQQDLNEGTGIYTAGETAGPDLDASGGFSAWSGRLRGGKRPFDLRFSLRVEAPAEGGFPVNAGYLDDRGRGSLAVPDYREFGTASTVHPYHKALEHVLNNLGALLLPAGGTHREVVQAGDSGLQENWFDLSWLGYDLLSRRSQGGYRTMEEVRSALLGAGYTLAECQLVEPYLNLGPLSYESLLEGGRARSTDGADFPPYVPVNLAVAPRQVLTALWMYLASLPPTLGGGGDEIYLPGTQAAWDTTCSSRTASLQFNPPLRTPPYNLEPPLLLLIFKDEADRLAERVMVLREAGKLTWKRLYQYFAREAEQIFKRDFDDLPPPPPTPFPLDDLAPWSWTQAKVDLAFQAVALDPFPYPDTTQTPFDGSCGGLAAWASWGVDRGNYNPTAGVFEFDPLDGVRPFNAASFQRIRRARYPTNYPASFPSNPADPWGNADLFRPYYGVSSTQTPVINAQGGIIAGPGRFRIRSHGRAASGRTGATLDADLRLAERLVFTSQQDFENFSVGGGGASLAKRGILLDDPDPAGRRSTYNDAAVGRSYPGVVSLPRANQRSFSGGPGFSRGYGALSLASRQTGMQGSKLYWPCKENFDGSLNNGGTWVNDDRGDFWHEVGPGPLSFPPPANPLLTSIATFRDTQGLTPYQAQSQSLQFQCPGISEPPGPGVVVNKLSIEAWISPAPGTGGNVWVWPSLANRIVLWTARSGTLYPQEPGTELGFQVSWHSLPGVVSGNWFFPDDPAVSRVSWTYHVVFTVQQKAGSTYFRLFVNGKDHPLGEMTADTPAEMTLPSPALAPDLDMLNLLHADEIRLYDVALDEGVAPAWPPPSQAPARRNLERFVRQGTFRSPLYVLDEPAKILACRWTGMIPPGFPNDSLVVNLYGFSDAAGTVPAWSPNPQTIPLAEVEKSLAGLPRVKSFYWEAAFDCTGVPAGEMTDTPVFESIQISLARPSRAPAWERMTQR